jgi:hypothetical protein
MDKEGRRPLRPTDSRRVSPWRWFETLGNETRQTTLYFRAPCQIRRDTHGTSATSLRRSWNVRKDDCQRDSMKATTRQDTHYRRTDGSAETRRHPRPLRLLHLTRLAKGQGLRRVVAQENAETAIPTVASRACFRRTPANWLRCWGVAKTRRTWAQPSKLAPVKPLVTTCQHRLIKSSSTSVFSSWPSADRRCTGLQVQGSFAEPLISSVWTRLGPSEDIHHPISFRALYCCTPFCFASSDINHTASPQIIASQIDPEQHYGHIQP